MAVLKQYKIRTGKSLSSRADNEKDDVVKGNVVEINYEEQVGVAIWVKSSWLYRRV